MLDAAVVGELLLELRRERSGREPAGLERVQHVGALLVAERGRGETERGCAGARCHGGKSRGWICGSDSSGRSLDPLAPSVPTPVGIGVVVAPDVLARVADRHDLVIAQPMLPAPEAAAPVTSTGGRGRVEAGRASIHETLCR